MDSFQNNQLLRNYNNYQQGAGQFQNNALLQNNPLFKNMNYNSQQIQALQNYQMQQMKEIQKVKQLEKLTDVQQKLSKEKLREIIIAPEKESKMSRKDLDAEWKKKQSKFEPERQEYYRGRTNQPYKHIIKNADFKKDFKNKDDLIVHRVTNADKEGVEEEFEHLQENLEKHNNELKVIYSLSKEAEHKKEFEYNHSEKFVRIRHDAPDHGEMKKDNLDYYKKQQKQLQGEKAKVDKIMESLVSTGLLNEDDIKTISTEKNKNNNTNIVEENKPKRIVVAPSQVKNMTKADTDRLFQQQHVEEQKPKKIVIAPQRTKPVEPEKPKPKVIIRQKSK